MKLDDIRAGIKLRSVPAHLSKDRSAPLVGVDVAAAERDQDAHESYYLDLGMDRWLPYVIDLTFETTSIPLTMADANVLRRAYAHLHARSYYDDMSKPIGASLPPDLIAALTELGQQLGPEMKALGAETNGVFGKLSGRSAKDSPLYTARLDEALSAHFSAHPSAADDDNGKLMCLFDASLELMRLRDPASLLWMLINSQRVDEDLEVAARHPERWDQAVVLRRWWDGVSTDLEFRMFVVDGKPTGLTQSTSWCTHRASSAVVRRSRRDCAPTTRRRSCLASARRPSTRRSEVGSRAIWPCIRRRSAYSILQSGSPSS